MVDVGVREHYSIDCVDINGQPEVLALRFTSAPLKHAAIEEHCFVPNLQDVTRAGHLTCRTGERDFHASELLRSLGRSKTIVIR
jgi:hypothetical protein